MNCLISSPGQGATLGYPVRFSARCNVTDGSEVEIWFPSEAAAEDFRAGMSQFYTDIRIERLRPEAITEMRNAAPVHEQRGEGEISISWADEFE